MSCKIDVDPTAAVPQAGLTIDEKSLLDFCYKYDGLSYQGKLNLILRGGIATNNEVYYLGYLPRDLAYIFHRTGQIQVKKVVSDILQIYMNEFILYGKLRSPLQAQNGEKYWSRDQFARDMRLLYQAYSYTGDISLLTLIETQARLWLSTVVRNNHNGFMVFPYNPMEPLSYEIDPNQNMVIASLFTYLYWDDASWFYLNEECKDIVYNEVNAALSLQKSNGALPLREGLPLVEDTNYGNLCGEYLYEIAQLWGEQRWITAAQKIGNWLYTNWPMDHPWNMREDYPNFSMERHDSYNLIGRITSFYAAGVDKSYTLQWINFTQQKFPETDLRLLSRGYFWQSIPPDYFGLSEQNNLAPIVNIRQENNAINIIVINSAVAKLEVDLVDYIGKSEYSTVINKPNDIAENVSCTPGYYMLKIAALSDNGKTTIKQIPLVIKGTATRFNYRIFDKNNPFSEK